MDTKRISQIWVRNMYHKFETVYQEFEESINKDPVKYVEDQIQTVGESVKNFCNGVMQDLILPPLVETFTNSATLIKENTNDNNNTNKPEEGSLIPTEKCQKPSPICESVIEEADTNPKFEHEGDDLMNKTSFEEEEVLYNKNSESDDMVFEDANSGIENIMEIEKKIEGERFVEENSEKVLMETLGSGEFECDSNSSTLSRMESLISCIKNKEEKEKEKSYDSSMSDSYTASSYEISSCESSTTFGYSSFALSNESTYELSDSMVDLGDLDMETIDLSDKEQLVEIVEGEKVFYFPYGSDKSKSYKKIIRDAFMSKKKLTKEYEQLALWCAIDKEFSQKIDKIATNVQVQDFPDSEWELL